MSQSSVEEQVKDLSSSGFPVRKGEFSKDRPEPVINPEQYSSDLWFYRWCRNVFRNYPIVSKAFGARFLCDACHGMPAFIVGIGPSLDNDIKELKAVKKRAIIIAVDAAIRPLLANGITPDLVVSFDCKEEQRALWKDIPADVKVPGLINSCTHPNTIASWPGPVLFFNQYHTQDELCHRILPDVLPDIGQIPSGGTVGNMAIMAGHLMGCDPICLVGFDFCLQPNADGWRYRAQDYRWTTNRGAGIPDGWEPTEIKELYDNDERVSRSFMIKGEGGHEFKSDPELKFYLQSFRNIMPHFKVPIVNCTPKGLIPKMAFKDREDTPEVCYPAMTITQAIEKFCKTEYQAGRNVLAHLDKIIPDPRVSA